jgi:uncharacterized delta-60 repeat protein
LLILLLKQRYTEPILIRLFLMLFLGVYLCSNAIAQSAYLDTTFAHTGKALARLDTTLGSTLCAVAVLPDGKILVSGEVNNRIVALRYTAAGVPDSSFGLNGIYNAGFSCICASMVIQPDGKPLIAGTTAYATGATGADFLIIRLKIDGTPDSSFGTYGMASVDFAGDEDHAYALALQPDGKIIVTGDAIDRVALARLLADGRVDSSFGVHGRVTTYTGRFSGRSKAVGVAPDGRILIGGHAYLDMAGLSFIAIRYLPNGTVDTSFNHTGLVMCNAGNTYNYAKAMQIMPDGKVVLAGTGTFSVGGSNFVLARYNINGSFDTSFGQGGIAVLDFAGEEEDALALALLPDGKLVVAGYATIGTEIDMETVRLTNNGRVDSSFGENGKITTDIHGEIDIARAIAVQPDGKVVLAGHSSTGTYNDLVVVRYIGFRDVSVPTIVANAADIALFPNPSSGLLTISNSSGLTIASVSATDIAGRQCSIEVDLNFTSIKLLTDNPAIYLLRITMQSGQTIVKRIDLRK